MLGRELRSAVACRTPAFARDLLAFAAIAAGTATMIAGAAPAAAGGAPATAARAATAADAAATAPVERRYVVSAAIDPAARTVSGTVEAQFRNTSAVDVDEVDWVLYANRFAGAEPGVNDANRPFIYPRDDALAGGGISIEEVEAWVAAVRERDAAPAARASPERGPRRAALADRRHADGRDDAGSDAAGTGDPGTGDAGGHGTAAERAGARGAGTSDAGGFMRVEDVRYEAVGEWPATSMKVRLPAPVAAGRWGVMRLAFRVALPERFGPFGVVDGRITALGGWFPTLAALTRDGGWDPAALPPPGDVRGELRAPPATTVAVGSAVVEAGHTESITLALSGARWPALLASDAYVVDRRDVDGVEVVLLELPPRYGRRFPPGRSHAAIMLDTIARVLRERPAGVPALPARLVVAEAPLRLELSAPSRPGVAIVSDRILRVHPLVRVFHERELATAVYAAVLRDHVDRREPPGDAAWVGDGVAAELADRWVAASYPRQRTVRDWIALFDVFAIVDRFESAPKIPFADAFFPERRRASELGDGIETFARDRPPGRTILGKLRNEIGDADYAQVIGRYLGGDEHDRADRSPRLTEPPLREVAAAVHGTSLEWLFAQWLAPYPDLDYALGATALDRRAAASSPRADAPSATGPARYRQVVPVTRRSSRPIREAVDVELVGPGGRRARYRWPGHRDEAELHLATPWRVRRVILDPDRRLLEDTRRNDEQPPPLQLVLDSADVTITSSEFGLSGLFVARQRYDYTKDLGLIGFVSDRSVGFDLGPRWHFGTPIDPTLYRHNVYAFYTLATLRGDFRDRSRPGHGDDGLLGGLGFRYDYTDEFAFDNPTDTTKVRLFGDWFSGALGSSFDYLDWGARLSVVRPLLSRRTLGALQVLNAFSAPTGGDRVPNQGRYSLGGDLAIRGIRVDERLGENVVLVRAELRQTIYPETDFNLLDWLVVRRGQLRLFVDSGRVEDRRSSLYRIGDFAVGVGVGAAMFYDFMGFYPAVAYVAIAERVDRFAGVDNRVQFLFGTRQAF